MTNSHFVESDATDIQFKIIHHLTFFDAAVLLNRTCIPVNVPWPFPFAGRILALSSSWYWILLIVVHHGRWWVEVLLKVIIIPMSFSSTAVLINVIKLLLRYRRVAES